MSSAPTLLEAAKLAKAAIVGRWQSGNGNARIESLENEAVERCTEAIAAAESACTETRVRFVVQHRSFGMITGNPNEWENGSRWHTVLDANTEIAELSAIAYQTDPQQKHEFRVVKETSVITREVLP